MRQVLEGFPGVVQVRKEDGGFYRITATRVPEATLLMEADVAWVARRPASIEMLYGRLDARRKALEQRMAVRFALDAFIGGVWSTMDGLAGKVERWLADKQAIVSEVDDPAALEATGDLVERGSIVKVSFLGAVAAVDHLDYDIHEMSRVVRESKVGDEGEVPLRNALRVHVPTPELLRILKTASVLVAQGKKDLGIDDEED